MTKTSYLWQPPKTTTKTWIQNCQSYPASTWLRKPKAHPTRKTWTSLLSADLFQPPFTIKIPRPLVNNILDALSLNAPQKKKETSLAIHHPRIRSRHLHLNPSRALFFPEMRESATTWPPTNRDWDSSRWFTLARSLLKMWVPFPSSPPYFLDMDPRLFIINFIC